MSSAPPLSLALNRPELPRGETEPEIMLLNNRQANSTSDDRFIHIMVKFGICIKYIGLENGTVMILRSNALMYMYTSK